MFSLYKSMKVDEFQPTAPSIAEMGEAEELQYKGPPPPYQN